MSTPLDDLMARIGELRADFTFVSTAYQLRPRLGDIIAWERSAETKGLVQRFLGAKDARPEGIYGPLLIRLIAGFERYIRLLIVESIEFRTSSVKSFDELPKKLINRNMILTGKILASLENPRDYLSFNIDGLIVNLASCKSGSTSFSLNPLAFSATVLGIKPTEIDKALESLDITDCWDGLGSDKKLETILGTKGARDTGSRAAERLKELSRWRNHLAHGGDEIVISDVQLVEAIEFVVLFSAALDATVKKQLKNATKSR
jgi:RiboL-PSP-HEPN